MKRIENDCVDCPIDIGCVHSACPYYNAPHYYCDECETETELYIFEDQELCIHCIADKLEKVKGSFYY